jgi:hypothetical protein
MMKRDVVIRRLRRFRSLLFVAGTVVWFGVATLPTFAAADSVSCSASPERQQFDYWRGDWTITYPGAPGGSTSKVYLRLGQMRSRRDLGWRQRSQGRKCVCL